MMHSACYGTGTSARTTSVACPAIACTVRPTTRDRSKVGREDQLGVGMDGDRACLQCHEKIGEDLIGHTRPQGRVERQPLLQLPHATHDVRVAQGHPLALHLEPRALKNNLASGRPNACNLCHLDQSLGWSAERLDSEWYASTGAATVERRTIVTVRRRPIWMLSGDARQRALHRMARRLGARPSRRQEDAWIAPVLRAAARRPLLRRCASWPAGRCGRLPGIRKLPLR